MDKGYESTKEASSPKILRFNDAFKYIKPLPTHSRTDGEVATSTFKGELGSNWKDQLVKLTEEEKLKESIAQFRDHKYPELEEKKEPTLAEKIQEKNRKIVKLMDDQEMRESVYKLFPTPHELKERKEQLEKSITEMEEEEEEEEDEQEKQKEF